MKSIEQMHSESDDFVCIVPAGGFGTRLQGLTADRAKPSLAISYDNSGEIRRMIDVPLKAIQSIGARAIVSTCYAAETLDFVDKYRHVSVRQEFTPQSPIDTIADAREWLDESAAHTIGIIPGDAYIAGDQLEGLYEAFHASKADAAILSTRHVAGHNVRPIDSRGNMTRVEQGTDYLADLGIHLFQKSWLMSRLNGHQQSLDVWTDIYNVDDPAGSILLHVPKQDSGWVDMGTPAAFYRTVATLNRESADKSGNITFPGSNLYGMATQTIALPSSSSDHDHTYAILPEGKQILEPEQAVVIA